jgi:outer membrane protein OmpA-like peptidoglycan-associated protein
VQISCQDQEITTAVFNFNIDSDGEPLMAASHDNPAGTHPRDPEQVIEQTPAPDQKSQQHSEQLIHVLTQLVSVPQNRSTPQSLPLSASESASQPIESSPASSDPPEKSPNLDEDVADLFAYFDELENSLQWKAQPAETSTSSDTTETEVSGDQLHELEQLLGSLFGGSRQNQAESSISNSSLDDPIEAHSPTETPLETEVKHQENSSISPIVLPPIEKSQPANSEASELSESITASTPESGSESPSAIEQEFSDLMTHFDELESLLNWPKRSEPETTETSVQRQHLSTEIIEPVNTPSIQPEVVVESSSLSTEVVGSSDNSALEQLQTLLLGSQISETEQFKKLLLESELPKVHQLLSLIDEKLGNLEYQIYEPKELIKLLLPSIAEILRLKVEESREDVIRAMVPIIDEVIKTKTRLDKNAMSQAIADLLPEAISHEIQNSPREIAKAIGPEIASAIQEQIRLDRNAISIALASEMGKAIKEQIRLERDAMVDALYPVIGNTIAKYIAEAVRTINEKVSNAFSIEGVQRKVRATVTGVSEGELILKESIPFTVQAVFLIQKSSGLVIAEVQQSGHQRLESEMVAGMLTAIRSFVSDCIVQSPEEISELNEIEYGDSKIVLEVAGYCYLAVVMKGEPPKEFLEKIRKTLATIILDYGMSIENFDGDSDKIPMQVQALLDRLIEISENPLKKKVPVALIGVCLVAAGLIAIPLGIYQYRQYNEQRIEAKAAQALSSTPELAVYRLNVMAQENTLTLAGKLPNEKLRTQAEQIARATAPNLQINNQIIPIAVPPDPVLMASEVQRVTAILNQMPGISISTQVDQQKVMVEGTVQQLADGAKITQAFETIPGVKSVANTIRLDPLTIKSRIYFEPGSTRLNPNYTQTLQQIKTFLTQYPQKSLKIIGHSDSVGSPTVNQSLALKRAIAVQNELIQQGVDPKRLQVLGSTKPPKDVEYNQPLLLSRCVVFELIPSSNQTR